MKHTICFQPLYPNEPDEGVSAGASWPGQAASWAVIFIFAFTLIVNATIQLDQSSEGSCMLML